LNLGLQSAAIGMTGSSSTRNKPKQSMEPKPFLTQKHLTTLAAQGPWPADKTPCEWPSLWILNALKKNRQR
jgi:hypothetical protein